jgi:hypothetical protein
VKAANGRSCDELVTRKKHRPVLKMYAVSKYYSLYLKAIP